MKPLFHLLCVLALFGVTGCYIQRPVYYVSPYNANATSYHALPLKKDSIKTATYATASFYLGTANSKSTDKVFSFAGNVYQARRFGNFQAYYGSDISIGNYKAATISSDFEYPTADWETLNARVGNKFFAGIGVNGGIHFFQSYRWGDWRIIGAEFATHAETGAYSRFRKDLPSTAADVIARSRAFSTAGLTTEITSKTKSGSFGFQLAGGLTVGNGYGHIYALNFNTQEYGQLRYGYFTCTFQETFQRWTAYAQVTSGRFAGGGRFGAVYRLGKK